MPPTSKITTQVLEGRLIARKGCVVEVADDLCISRNEVYRKAKVYGLEIAAYKEMEVTFTSDGVEATPSPCMSSVSSDESSDTQPCNATLTVEAVAHRFGGMVEQVATASAAAIADIGAEIAARSRKVQPQKARLLPEQEREQNEFRREMMACLNAEVSPSDVLQQFHKRYFRRMVEDFRAVYAKSAEPKR